MVLSVNIYSAGSSGSLSGNQTRAVRGIGGSRLWTSWYGDILVVRDTVMFTLKVTGASQFDQAFWFSPRVTALSSRLMVPNDLSICALLRGFVERSAPVVHLE